jgi:hypothetical protein
MERVELLPLRSDTLEVHVEEDRLRVKTSKYTAEFLPDKPYLQLYDAHQQPWASFYIPGSVDTTEAADESCGMESYEYEQEGETLTVRIPVDTAAWQSKTAVWKFHPGLIETYFEVEGAGNITACRYFGGNYNSPNETGSMWSASAFERMFSPEPHDPVAGEAYGQGHAGEPAHINVTGTSSPGRKHWLMTPAPYQFSFARRESDQEWLSAGIAAPIEQQNFTEFRYETRQRAFALCLDYEGHTQVEGTFRTPSILLHWSNDPVEAITSYRQHAQYLGHLTPLAKTPSPDWHYLPGRCGWGAAVELESQHPGSKAQDFARQDIYESDDELLARRGIVPGVKTIDDKWQAEYGTNEADTTKWPDLQSYVHQSHTMGQRVLLWLKVWDREGLPDELCVRNHRGMGVTTDPSNPAYVSVLEAQVERMLSSDGYDADGFKLDFTARTPSGRHLESYGGLWGTALLHRMLEVIHDTAKRVKPDAMIVAHTPNPWFENVMDVSRLNDVLTSVPLVMQMQDRERVARAACPSTIIDTDNWPMPSRTEWRRYLQAQPELGVPWLYFVDRVAGERLTRADFAAIRRTFARYMAQLPLIASEKIY